MLDLDAIERYDTIPGDIPALVAELRKLREENARLKGFVENVVENFDCDCDELRYDLRDPAAICFWCKAKKALPKPPEVG